jgi:hypothetical protein
MNGILVRFNQKGCAPKARGSTLWLSRANITSSPCAYAISSGCSSHCSYCSDFLLFARGTTNISCNFVLTAILFYFCFFLNLQAADDFCVATIHARCKHNIDIYMVLSLHILFACLYWSSTERKGGSYILGLYHMEDSTVLVYCCIWSGSLIVRLSSCYSLIPCLQSASSSYHTCKFAVPEHNAMHAWMRLCFL